MYLLSTCDVTSCGSSGSKLIRIGKTMARKNNKYLNASSSYTHITLVLWLNIIWFHYHEHNYWYHVHHYT